MREPDVNKNKSFLKKCIHADTRTKHMKENKLCVSQGERQAQHKFTVKHTFPFHKHSRTQPRRRGESDSLSARPVDRGPDALVHEGGWGHFDSWNTQGLSTQTSFNLICIRAVFGGKHRFSLSGGYTGSRKTATDGASLPRTPTADPLGKTRHCILKSQPHTRRHTHSSNYLHTSTQEQISCFTPITTILSSQIHRNDMHFKPGFIPSIALFLEMKTLNRFVLPP